MNSTKPHSRILLKNVQVLRAIAVLIVVVFHVATVEEVRDYSTNYLAPFMHFGNGGVNLFFVISGFIITWINREKLGDASQIPNYIVRRFLRIYPIYWVCWLCAFGGGLYFLGRSTPYYGVVPNELLCELLLLPQTWKFWQLPQAWSLTWEIVFYGLFTIFLVLPQRWFLPVLGVFASILVWNHWQQWSESFLLNVILLNFIGGCLSALALFRFEGRWAKTALAVGLGMFALGAVSNWIGWTDREPFADRVLCFGIPSALIVYGAAGWEWRDGKTFLTWLEPIGNSSYAIYLTHLLVFEVIRDLTREWPVSIVWHIAFLVGMTVSALVIGHATYRVVELPLIQLFKQRRSPRTTAFQVVGCSVSLVIGFLLISIPERQVGPVSLFSWPVSMEGHIAASRTEEVVTINDLPHTFDANITGEIQAIDVDGTGRIRIDGFAVDDARQQIADAIAIFVDGQLKFAGRPVTPKPSLDERVQHGVFTRSGFRFDLPPEQIQSIEKNRFRVFAIFEDDRIAELFQRPPQVASLDTENTPRH